MKIAVCLSGQIRYWDSTYPFFEYWNNLFKDVEYTFFVSTWQNNDSWYEQPKFGDIQIDDVDFSKYEFITRYSKHNPDDVNINHSKNAAKLPNTPYMTYLYNKVHGLRNSYEKENNMEFDFVIQTRNDIVFGHQLLSKMIFLWNTNSYILNNSIFSPSGSKLKIGGNKKDEFLLVVNNDNLFFGNPKVMNHFKNMYDFLIYDSFNKHTHYLQAEYFHRNKIMHFSTGDNPYLLRYGKTIKRHRPTPDSLRRIMEEKGIEWFYNTRIEDVSKEYWDYG